MYVKMNDRLHKILRSNPAALILNLLWLFVAYEVTRLAFLAENWAMFRQGMTWTTFVHITEGGFKFDTSAIFYTNVLFIVMFLMPVPTRPGSVWQRLTRWVYVVVNSVCLFLNLADTVFFEFRKHRTSMAVFEEFKGENNLAGILGDEIIGHWYLVLLFVGLICFLWMAYRKPGTPAKPVGRFVAVQLVTLVVIAPFVVFGMRGNTFFSATRPIAVSYAHRYVTDPLQTGIVLNTPFSIIRTIHQMAREIPVYFTDKAEMDALYSPVHMPADSTELRKKNIVILIVESFAQEFVGSLNKHLDGGTYKGYTPFADGLIERSVTFEQSFANAGFSIDAPPAVLASIPRMDRPFVLSPYSLNHLNSIATETAKLGYTTAFFHGADNESLGFNAFVRSIGVERYYGQDEYLADKRFGGKKDLDGTWGIWDEPFLQFFAQTLDELPQPFMASVFTLSSHHPFNIPAEYRDTFPDEGLHKLHKCIRYADHSLRRFFETAEKMPWYKNTIFVLTADHASSKRTHEEYFGEVGGFRIPIIFFDPSGDLPAGRRPGIVQQIDIMPTILGYIGVKDPYVAFGKDVFNTPAEDTWAFNWDFYPQYFKGDYVMRTDGTEVTEIYDYVHDPLLKENLKGRFTRQKEMEREMQAIIQSYMERMKANELRIEN